MSKTASLFERLRELKELKTKVSVLPRHPAVHDPIEGIIIDVGLDFIEIEEEDEAKDRKKAGEELTVIILISNIGTLDTNVD